MHYVYIYEYMYMHTFMYIEGLRNQRNKNNTIE